MAQAEHIRYFIALPVAPPAPAESLIEALRRFSPQVKPVEPTALHLTLRFLGPASAERVRAAGDAMESALDQAATGPITVQWGQPTLFPRPTLNKARTIVLPPAEAEDASPLHRLETAISDALARLDPPIEREARGFSPHLTLARLKKTRGKHRVPADALEATLARYAETAFESTTLDRVVLFESTLTPNGPHYAVMRDRAL